MQPTQQAVVPASISLDPGVGTGNQTSPGADAGGKAYSVTTQRYGRSDLDGIFNVQVPEGFVPRAEREAAAAGGLSGGGRPPTAVGASPAPSEGGGRPLPPELRRRNLQSAFT